MSDLSQLQLTPDEVQQVRTLREETGGGLMDCRRKVSRQKLRRLVTEASDLDQLKALLVEAMDRHLI